MKLLKIMKCCFRAIVLWILSDSTYRSNDEIFAVLTSLPQIIIVNFLLFYSFAALNMSGNSIPILSARQFSRLGLVNLQRISMARCGLAQMDGHAFGGLNNMVELDLSFNELQEVSTYFALFSHKTVCSVLNSTKDCFQYYYTGNLYFSSTFAF